VLGQGEVSQKLFVAAEAFSASARRKIEEAGGFVQLLAEPAQADMSESGSGARSGEGSESGAQATSSSPAAAQAPAPETETKAEAEAPAAETGSSDKVEAATETAPQTKSRRRTAKSDETA